RLRNVDRGFDQSILHVRHPAAVYMGAASMGNQGWDGFGRIRAGSRDNDAVLRRVKPSKLQRSEEGLAMIEEVTTFTWRPSRGSRADASPLALLVQLGIAQGNDSEMIQR